MKRNQLLYTLAGLFLCLNAFSQKKMLDHTVYDGWQSTSERAISNNGRYVVYAINPQEGNSTLIIQYTDGKLLREIPRGYNAAITADNHYLVCKIKPAFAETRAARIKKKKPDEMPKDSLAVLDLVKNELVKYARIKSYKLPEANGNWLAYLAEKKLPQAELRQDSLARINHMAHLADSLNRMADSIRNKLALVKEKGWQVLPEVKKEKNGAGKDDDHTEEGTLLVLKNLATGAEKQFPLTSEYVFDKNGTVLAISTTPKKEDSASKGQVLWLQLPGMQLHVILAGINDARSLAFDEAGNQLAFVAERDSAAGAVQKFYQLWHYKKGNDTARLLATRYTTGLPRGWGISENGTIQFSKTGNRLFFGTAPILPPKDTLPEFERVNLDIWNYKDKELQTVQLFNLNRDLKKTYTAMYDWHNSRIVQLADTAFRTVHLTGEGDGAVFYLACDSGKRVPAQWQGFVLNDLYAFDVSTGKKILIEKNFKGNLYPSYTGKYLLLYHDRERYYTIYNTAAQRSYRVAADIAHPLYDEDNDVPDDPNPYGIMGWSKDDQYVCVYDRYDIWKVDPENKVRSQCITGDTRKTKTQVRYVKLNAEEQFVDAGKPMHLSMYNEGSKKTVYAIQQQTPLRESPADYSVLTRKFITPSGNFTSAGLVKADSAAVYLYTRESFTQSPDIYVTSAAIDSQQQAKQQQISGWHAEVWAAQQLSHLNPQQAQYSWGTAELYKWKAYTGRLTEGVLYKPDNFDAKKKYPMIVYFYERNNQTLYNYLQPAPTPSRLNIPFFVSRGYVVFVPDIWYKTGHPGKGAYDYIVSGTRALIKDGFIDSTKIGLQGQSWGGYQTAYLITQTNLYAAAWAGAPVVNMFSAYGGIRWESGLNRQFQYEKTQSRIGATIWDKPELYVENSPLFHLPKVKTPLVIMSNDADGAVPWYQGIEFFTAMRRLNKPVWLLNYNGEAHNLVERKNRKDIQIREQEFFDWLLKGAPPAGWITNGVPAVMKGREWGL